MLVVLCIVPKRGGKGGGINGNTREDYVEKRNGRMFGVLTGHRKVIEGSAGTQFEKKKRKRTDYGRVSTIAHSARLGSGRYACVSIATWYQRSVGGVTTARRAPKVLDVSRTLRVPQTQAQLFWDS